MFIIERYIVVYNTKHHYSLLHIEIFYYFMKSFPVQTFFFCHCIVCPSSIHGFGLPFCYLQTFIKHVIYRSNVLFAQRSISLHYI
jgi:hypothetical protein